MPSWLRQKGNLVIPKMKSPGSPYPPPHKVLLIECSVGGFCSIGRLFMLAIPIMLFDIIKQILMVNDTLMSYIDGNGYHYIKWPNMFVCGWKLFSLSAIIDIQLIIIQKYKWGGRQIVQWHLITMTIIESMALNKTACSVVVMCK